MKKSRFNHPARFVTRAAMIAAVYVVLTTIMWEYSYAALQVRLSEALCILPLILPEAIPGLFVGCVVSNLIVAGQPLDIIFGSLTTLLAAFLTYKIGYIKPTAQNGYKRLPIKSGKYWLAASMPVILNALIVGTIVLYLYGFAGFGIEESNEWKYLPLSMLTVGIGEAIAVFGLGTLLYAGLKRVPASVLD